MSEFVRRDAALNAMNVQVSAPIALNTLSQVFNDFFISLDLDSYDNILLIDSSDDARAIIDGADRSSLMISNNELGVNGPISLLPSQAIMGTKIFEGAPEEVQAI